MSSASAAGHGSAASGMPKSSPSNVAGSSTNYARISNAKGGREIEVRVELPPDMGASRRPQSACGGHGHDATEGNINLRGAMIHVLGDLLQVQVVMLFAVRW